MYIYCNQYLCVKMGAVGRIAFALHSYFKMLRCMITACSFLVVFFFSRYEVDNRYMCQPSREDVFKLLVALHETRAGNGGKSINFCNRRRSAGAIFTNIRFLGRK